MQLKVLQGLLLIQWIVWNRRGNTRGLSLASYQEEIDYCRSGGEPWGIWAPPHVRLRVNFQPVLIRIWFKMQDFFRLFLVSFKFCSTLKYPFPSYMFFWTFFYQPKHKMSCNLDRSVKLLSRCLTCSFLCLIVKATFPFMLPTTDG